MKVEEFIKRYCRCCDDFDYGDGCRAYLDEECDDAFVYPRWHGKTMRERVDEYCAKHLAKRKLEK